MRLKYELHHISVLALISCQSHSSFSLTFILKPALFHLHLLSFPPSPAYLHISLSSSGYFCLSICLFDTHTHTHTHKYSPSHTNTLPAVFSAHITAPCPSRHYNFSSLLRLISAHLIAVWFLPNHYFANCFLIYCHRGTSMKSHLPQHCLFACFRQTLRIQTNSLLISFSMFVSITGN